MHLEICFMFYLQDFRRGLLQNQVCFEVKKLQTKIIDCFHLTIFISVSAKKLMKEKSKVDEQTLEELNLARRRSQAKC